MKLNNNYKKVGIWMTAIMVNYCVLTILYPVKIGMITRNIATCISDNSKLEFA